MFKGSQRAGIGLALAGVVWVVLVCACSDKDKVQPVAATPPDSGTNEDSGSNPPPPPPDPEDPPTHLFLRWLGAESAIRLGWSGAGHNLFKFGSDPVLTVRIGDDCEAGDEVCSFSGPVKPDEAIPGVPLGGVTNRSPRCVSNPDQECDKDEDCGDDGLCRYLVGPPIDLPLSSDGLDLPACAQLELDSGATSDDPVVGTINFRTGEAELKRFSVLARIGVGCAECRGDEVFYDGKRDGKCTGIDHGTPCDVDAVYPGGVTASFTCRMGPVPFFEVPPTPFELGPSKSTSVAWSLDEERSPSCGADQDSLCWCGVCTIPLGERCHLDSDCDRNMGGTCEAAETSAPAKCATCVPLPFDAGNNGFGTCSDTGDPCFVGNGEAGSTLVSNGEFAEFDGSSTEVTFASLSCVGDETVEDPNPPPISIGDILGLPGPLHVGLRYKLTKHTRVEPEMDAGVPECPSVLEESDGMCVPKLVSVTSTQGVMTPEFDKDQFVYSLRVDPLVARTRMLVEAGAEEQTVLVDSRRVSDDGMSEPVSIPFGTSQIAVTAAYGVASQNYRVEAYRPPVFMKPPNLPANEQSGDVVAIGDNIAILASKHANSGETDGVGAAHIFRWSNGNWVFEQRLQPPSPLEDDQFGYAAVTNGEWIAISAIGREKPGAQDSDHGAVFLYQHDGATWALEQTLYASNPEGEHRFGVGMTMTDDLLAIGAQRAGASSNSGMGTVTIFELINGTWTETGEVQASKIQGNNSFGASIAYGDGFLFVGAPTESNGNLWTGAAYSFERGNGWQQKQRFLPPSAVAGGLFGASLARNGGILLISEPRAENTAGAVHVYRQQVFGFSFNYSTKLHEIPPYSQMEMRFGTRVALAGSYAIVASPYYDDVNREDVGRVWVYDLAIENEHLVDEFEPQFADVGDRFGFSLATSGNRVVVGAPGDDSETTVASLNGNKDFGAGHFFSYP